MYNLIFNKDDDFFFEKIGFHSGNTSSKFRFVIHKESGNSISITKSQGARLLPHSCQPWKLYAKINRYKTLS